MVEWAAAREPRVALGGRVDRFCRGCSLIGVPGEDCPGMEAKSRPLLPLVEAVELTGCLLISLREAVEELSSW